MLLAVGCSDDAGHPEEFDFNVTAHWTKTEHPEVTSLTIDGEYIADGRTWTFDDGETSYVDASDSFVKGATVTTAAGQKTSLIKLATCNHLDQVTLKSLGHLIAEEDVYAIDST